MSDFPLSSDSEPLSYLQRKYGYDEGRTDDAGLTINPASSFPWPDDPDERIWTPVYMSLNEYTALLSAVDVGAAIAWTDDALLVYYILVRNFSGGNMEFCARLIACILSDSDTKNALRNFIINDPSINQLIHDIADYEAGNDGTDPTNTNDAALNRNLLKPDECDNDFIFNQVTVLVDLLAGIVQDLFETVEVETNAAERAEQLISAIPVIGGIVPFDELIDVADNLVESVQENYDDKYDEALYDTIRCGLFCAVKDSCVMSINDAFAFYEREAVMSLPDNVYDGLAGIVQFIGSGDFPGDTIVYAMHLLALAAIRAGETVFGIDFGRLGLRVTAAGDDGNNDWDTLCEDCPDDDPCDTYTFVLEPSPGVSYRSVDKLGSVGDTISIDVSGYFQEYVGGPHISPHGNGSGPAAGDSNFLAQNIDKNVAMARVQGETRWHMPNASDHIEWNAESTGLIEIGVNSYQYLEGNADSFGTMVFDVCVNENNSICFDFTQGTLDWAKSNNPLDYGTDAINYPQGWGDEEPAPGHTWSEISGVCIIAPESIEDMEVRRIEITFHRAWNYPGVEAPDLERFFVIIQNFNRTGKVIFPTGDPQPLMGDNESLTYTFIAPVGPWRRPNIQVVAGGYTWPVDQYLAAVCLYETVE